MRKTISALALVLLCIMGIGHVAEAKTAKSHTPSMAKAKNVILFIGDGMGLSSLDAASIHAYQKPQALYFFQMPHMALVDTTSTSHWVTDAGAAATAMATGTKTANRMVSTFPNQAADATVTTLADYAEAHGLSTGGISDANITNPLISAYYARQSDRNKLDEVFLQILEPRAGNGMDILVGPGRQQILSESGLTFDELTTRFKAKNYQLASDLRPLSSPKADHSVILLDSAQFDLNVTVNQTISQLSQNPKGYFLVVHSDCHLKDVRKSLDCVAKLDKIVQSVSAAHSKDTLVIVTADHAYGIRVEGQKITKGPDVLAQISLLDDHTGEDVPVLAIGPGAERIKGFAPNTAIFNWIYEAFGWPKP